MTWLHPSLLSIVPAAALVASLALLVYALRARRLDDHPICRRCGFDLVGKPAGVTRCSECGANLARKKAVRVGHRARRYGLMAVAAPPLLLCGGGMGLVAWASARGVNLNPHKPTWWLASEAGSGSAPVRDAAMSELLDRLLTGRLSKMQVRDVAARVLDCQANPALPWRAPWNQFLEQARDDRLLSDEQWAQYARQVVVLDLKAASAGARSETLNVTVQSQFRDGAHKRFLARVWWTAPILIDDKTGPGGESYEPLLIDFGAGGSTVVRGFALPKHLLPEPDGPSRTVQVPVEVEVYEVDYSQVHGVNWWTSRPDPAWRLAQFRTTLTATWRMPPRLWVDDPRLAPAVAAAVRVTGVSRLGKDTWTPEVAVTVQVDQPPVNLAYTVVLRTTRTAVPIEQKLGTFTCAAGRSVRLDVGRGDVLAPKGSRVDVVLKPSVDAAAAAFNPVQLWAREVVFKDITIREAAAPAGKR